MHKKKSALTLLREKLIYHILIFGIINRLARIGLEFRLFYLVQEGIFELDPPQIKGNVSDYSIKFLEKKDMGIIGAYQCGASEEGFLSKLNKNEKCLGLLHKENIIGFVWFDFNECNYKHYRFKLNKNETYLYFLYIADEFRGKNLASYLRYHSYNILKKSGITAIYSTIQYFNRPAIRSKKKVKGKTHKLILYVQLFKKINIRSVLKNYKS